jgi:hypothetical protein
MYGMQFHPVANHGVEDGTNALYRWRKDDSAFRIEYTNDRMVYKMPDFDGDGVEKVMVILAKGRTGYYSNK